ncbi:hypothetical protein EJB05_11789, partial [Eragrostis curvula]
MWVLPLDFGIALLFEPFLSPLHFELVALLRLGFGAVTGGDLPAIFRHYGGVGSCLVGSDWPANFRSEEMSIGFSSNEDPDLLLKMQYCSLDLPYCFVLVPHSIAAWTGSGQGLRKWTNSHGDSHHEGSGSQYQQSSSGKAHLLNLARAAAVMKESMLSLMIEVILLPRASVYEV